MIIRTINANDYVFIIIAVPFPLVVVSQVYQPCLLILLVYVTTSCPLFSHKATTTTKYPYLTLKI